MKRLLILAGGLLLAGCAGDTMRDSWPKLKGQPISEAVRRFGYPQSEQSILGDKVYTWTSIQGQVVTTPVASTTIGPAGGAYTTIGYGAAGVDLRCEVKIATDQAGTIKTLQYDGNNGACMQFADAMRRD